MFWVLQLISKTHTWDIKLNYEYADIVKSDQRFFQIKQNNIVQSSYYVLLRQLKQT